MYKKKQLGNYTICSELNNILWSYTTVCTYNIKTLHPCNNVEYNVRSFIYSTSAERTFIPGFVDIAKNKIEHIITACIS